MNPTLRKPLIVGNWKMYQGINDSIKLITALKNGLSDRFKLEIVVAPSFTCLYSISIAIQDTPIKLGAQNCFWEEEGAYTGEISPVFLKEMDCRYCLVGHSERREIFQETDEIINKKIRALLGAEITPIFCIGETLQERKQGHTFAVLERQIKRGLADFSLHDLERFVIAYEPIWAIGTGEVATPEQISEAHYFIRNLIAKTYDAPTANAVRILYGGSVKSGNIQSIVLQKEVDGVLVGSASTQASEFIKIIGAHTDQMQHFET